MIHDITPYLLQGSAGRAVAYVKCGSIVFTCIQVDTSPLASGYHKLEGHIDPHSQHVLVQICVVSLRTWHNLATEVLPSLVGIF